MRGATWTAENRLRFWAESDGGTTTSKSQRCPKTGVRPGGGASIAQVRDPAESVAFCEKYLGCKEIAVTDATLCARSVPLYAIAAPRS